MSFQELDKLSSKKRQMPFDTQGDFKKRRNGIMNWIERKIHRKVFRNNNALPYLGLVMSQAIMAGWSSVGNKAINKEDGIHVAVFLVVRLFITFLTLGAMLVFRSRDNLLPDAGDTKAIVLVGFLYQCLSPIFFLKGLRYVTGTIGSLFDGPLVTILVYLLAVYFKLEKIPKSPKLRLQLGVSLALTIGGATATILAADSSFSPDDNHESNHSTSLGLLYLMIESIGQSAGLVLGKPLLIRYNVKQFSTWTVLVGFVCCLCMVLVSQRDTFFTQIGNLVFACTTSASYAFALLYGALASGVLNTLLVSYCNAKLPSSVVAVSACLQPMIALALDYYVYGIAIKSIHGIAFCMIIVGMRLFMRTAGKPTKIRSAAV